MGINIFYFESNTNWIFLPTLFRVFILRLVVSGGLCFSLDQSLGFQMMFVVAVLIGRGVHLAFFPHQFKHLSGKVNQAVFSL